VDLSYLKPQTVPSPISAMSTIVHNGKTRLSPAPSISETGDVVDHLSPGGKVLISSLDMTAPQC